MQRAKNYPYSNDNNLVDLDDFSTLHEYEVVENTLWRFTLLDKQYYYVVPCTLSLYILLQSLVGLFHPHFHICREEHILPNWVHIVNIGSTSSFVLSGAFNLIKIISSSSKTRKDRALKKIYLVLLSVCAIAGSSQLLTFINNYGGICKDPLGVYSPAAQWVEFFVSVPFLAYIACAVENKVSPSRFDVLIIGSFSFMLFFGYLLIISTSIVVGALCLTGTMSLFIFVYIIYTLRSRVIEEELGKEDMNSDREDFILLKFLHQRQYYHSLSLIRILLFILPLFPLIYFLALIKVFDANYTIASYFICSVVGKLLFATYVVDSHISFQDDLVMVTSKHKSNYLKRSAENHANELRHMIANVAHDLKTPLSGFISGLEMISSIAKEGIDVVQKDLYSKSSILENYRSIEKSATNVKNINSFMLMTINRCIDYTKASKGMKLIPKFETIELQETLDLPLSCMKDLQGRVDIHLKKLPESICSHIVTDKQWLQENILCLLSNAVKYSHQGSVTINILFSNSKTDLQNHPPEIESYTSSKENKESTTQLPSELIPPSDCRSFSIDSVTNFNGRTSVRANGNTSSRVPFVRLGMNFLSSNYDAKYSLSKSSSKKVHLTNTSSSSRNDVGYKFVKNTGSFDADMETGAKNYVVTAPLPKYLVVEVEDMGIGLSKEVMENLFNPFKQAQRLAGGTGLGLFSLAKRIEAMHGYYGVRNRSDGLQGSVFWFAFPYRPDESFASLLTMNSEKDGPDTSSLSIHSPIYPETAETEILMSTVDEKKDKGVNILLVDDSVSILKMTSMILKRQGHTVTQAVNGADAVEKIVAEYQRQDRLKQKRARRSADVLSSSDGEVIHDNARPYDIVIMDLQMPVMDGLEATRRIREIETNGSILNKPNDKQDDSRHGLNATSNARLISDESKNRETSTDLRVSTVECGFSKILGSGVVSQRHQLIVGVSANSDHETAVEAHAAGVDFFMGKPFTINMFNEVIVRFIS